MSYRETEADCKGCGANLAERKNYSPDRSGLSRCPHCDEEKCPLCDMGDDVHCGNCPDED